MRRIAAELADVVLVCRKCSKRVGSAFGPDEGQTLSKALRRALASRPGHRGRRKGRHARFAVATVDCLDICPKGAVLALRADRPGDWVLVPKGAGIDEVVASLGFDGPADAEVL